MLWRVANWIRGTNVRKDYFKQVSAIGDKDFKEVRVDHGIFGEELFWDKRTIRARTC